MEWLIFGIVLSVANTPVFYRMNKKLNAMEQRIDTLGQSKNINIEKQLR